MRVSELAKELGLTSKEVIEKLASIQIVVKTHSSAVTPDQVKRLKDFIAGGSKTEVKKPKAFIVKKAKPEEKPEVKVVEQEKATEQEEVKSEPSKTVEKVERPKVEVVKKAPVNRLEIVRHASKPSDRPQRPSDRPQRPQKPGDKQKTADKPIERHIIPQDIYENKGSSSKHKQSDKRKDKISK